MVNRFTPKAQASLTSAKRCAEKMGHSYIGSEHLILGILCNDCMGKKLLEDKHITYNGVYNKLVEIAGTGNEESSTIRELTPKCRRVIEGSGGCAKRFGSHLIGTEHILYSLCEEGESVGGRILTYLGLNLQIFKNEIAATLDKETSTRNIKDISGAPILSTHGKSLNQLARQGKCDPLIGRERELGRLIQILSRRTKNNPCLIGSAGVGKTAIVEGLASKIVKGEVPPFLSDKIIVSLDLPSMIAGTKYRGEFEERMRGLLNELSQNESIIVFIDEIHTIMGAGGAEGAIDASNILKPALARGQIQVIGATTTDEYRRYIEKDCALERRFQPISVKEPEIEEAINIIRGLKGRYQDFHKVTIPDSIIENAVKLSVRYIPDRYLPDKAIDIIDEACAIAKMNSFSIQGYTELKEQLHSLSEQKERAILSESFDLAKSIRNEEISVYKKMQKATQDNESKRKNSSVILENRDIEAVVEEWTGIPVRCDSNDINQEHLEEELKKRIIGQDAAISSVVSSIKRGFAGLKSHNKPIGTYLFLGPTGVGKTELAKAIAKEAFRPSGDLIRLDMSEYGEKHSVAKLIGAPPGYVGYEDGGSLTKMVKQKPYSVVLFDEIEKAHPDIYNILLQILDEGSLTDSQGKTVSFKNTIVILTSNVGATSITDNISMGFSLGLNKDEEYEKMALKIKGELKGIFRPELLNRLDEVVIFNKLSKEDATHIVSIMLKDLCRLTEEMGIKLNIGESISSHIAELSYDNSCGARPLKRGIMKLLETPLSEKILSKELKKGDYVSVFLEDSIIKIKSVSAVLT